MLDVGRHVEITPRTVAANIESHLTYRQLPVTERLSPQAGGAQVLESLTDGATSLDSALEQLDDKDLDGMLPGPAGPMPGRAALDLALTELALHRCDIELGLGLAPEIDQGVTPRLIDVIQAWLLLTAPSDPVPCESWCLELRSAGHSWFFAFDGSRWSDRECRTADVIAPVSAAQAVLALAGRETTTQFQQPASDLIAHLKTYLPSP